MSWKEILNEKELATKRAFQDMNFRRILNSYCSSYWKECLKYFTIFCCWRHHQSKFLLRSMIWRNQHIPGNYPTILYRIMNNAFLWFCNLHSIPWSSYYWIHRFLLISFKYFIWHLCIFLKNGREKPVPSLAGIFWITLLQIFLCIYLIHSNSIIKAQLYRLLFFSLYKVLPDFHDQYLGHP